jgi:tetratricopeptide (TPR) repeat protein
VVREAVVASLPAHRRIELHVGVAEFLVRAVDATENASLITHHYLAAGTPAATSEALAWGRRAAREALARGAHEAATETLERLLRVATDSNVGDTAALVAAELAEARMIAGEWSQGVRACEHAAALARASGCAGALGRVALARGIQSPLGRVDREHVALLEEALMMLGEEDPGLRVQVMARLAAALQPSDSPKWPLSLARDAIAKARTLDDPETLARTLLLVRGAFRPLEDLAERMAIDEESLGLAERLRDRMAQLMAHQHLVFGHLEAGDRPAADAHMRAYRDLARELGSRRAAAQDALFQAATATLDGSPERALEHWKRGAEITSTLDDGPVLVDPVRLQRLALARWWGDRGALEVALTECPLPDGMRSAHAHALVLLGRLDEARHVVETTLARGGPFSYLHLIGIAEPCARVGDVEGARRIYEALRPFEARHAVWWGSSGACDGCIARPLALLAERLGSRSHARAHFERALRENQRLGAPAIIARTREDFGRFLLEDGVQGEDRAVAARLLDRARRTYEACRMALDLERIDELTRSRPGVGASDRSDAAPALGMSRDGAVWRIAAGAHHAVVPDSDGLRYLAYLIERPATDVHVLELVGESRARRSARHEGALPGHDAGLALDAEAKAAYRMRLAELREDLDEADGWSDRGRAEAIAREIEHLTQELGQAVGLGGRDRPQKATAERARVNVTQRIRRAMALIAEQSPALGDLLDRSVRTGTLCRYAPTRR